MTSTPAVLRFLAAWLALASTAVPAASLSDAVTALQAGGFRGQVLAGDAQRVRFESLVGLPAPRVWIWGSVSKQVTAALVMQEIERQTLRLDDRIIDRLPGFPNAQAGEATVRQLLLHTSGLANPDSGPAVGELPAFYARAERGSGARRDALGTCAGPMAGERGRFSYNNCDTIVLGAILERVTGKSFAQLLEARIARPLDLRSVRMARAGERLPFGATQAQAVRIDVAAYGPAGAIVGTAADLLRLDQALLSGRLVSRASLDVLWQGHPELGYAAPGAWVFEAPLRGCEGAVRLVERRGIVDGVQSRNLIAPERARALVVFTPDPAFEFGEIWQGQGPAFELASAAFCGPGA